MERTEHIKHRLLNLPKKLEIKKTNFPILLKVIDVPLLCTISKSKERVETSERAK